MLGEWIKKQRTAMGMTQRELGSSIGVMGSAISKWERDTNAPARRNIRALAQVFDVPACEIMRMKRDPQKFQDKKEGHSAEGLSAWLRKMRDQNLITYQEMSSAVYYSGNLIKLWVTEDREPHTQKAARSVCWLADLFGAERAGALALLPISPERQADALANTARLPSLYDDGQLARWLTESRQLLGLTTLEAARRVGASRHTYHRWQTGECLPSFEHCQQIADGFNIPAEEILRLAGYNELGGLEPAVEIKRGRCDCEKCKRAAECREAMNAGLPLLCEAISAEDIFIADWRGQIDHLLARYNGKANEKRSKLEAMYEYNVAN